jgi:hypothetical protein
VRLGAQQIVEAAHAAESPDFQRQVTALLRHERNRHDVISRRESPAGRSLQQRVIAWMVIVVGDHRIKDHAHE